MMSTLKSLDSKRTINFLVTCKIPWACPSCLGSCFRYSPSARDPRRTSAVQRRLRHAAQSLTRTPRNNENVPLVLLLENKIDGQYQKYKTDKVIYPERLGLEKHHRENHKDDKRDDLLNHLKLY
jgi:hypothetical protein